ncbi:MAG: LLM class flavin-dependent oxidoreductase [Myxococcales bacterium]|nr:LLM class flavin-dependent oxidoreductase [Myxococcales bacterium]
MKFMYFFLPSLPATPVERKDLRPIAHHTERWQRMFDEVVEIARMAEDLGFTGVAFPEHHLHTEGMEIGSLPVLTQYVIHNTSTLKVGPIGYVLPGWNPLRLALEIAWLDQLTKGRTHVGFARGYQSRWLNQMAQKIHIGATASDQSELDRKNREAFEEVFQILKLAWKDEPFRFNGKYYQYPFPYEEGTPWAANEWTRGHGSPGELDDNGNIRAIDIVPKPYQKPHPTLFQAFSMSEATVRWCARETIVPTLFVSDYEQVRFFAETHVEEARSVGRNLELGESLGVLRGIYAGSNLEEAKKLLSGGMCGYGFQNFFHHFGFTEAFRTEEDNRKYGDQPLPPSEATPDRMIDSNFALAGSTDDIRRGMDRLIEAGNPEWFIWQGDQGLLPIEEVKRMVEKVGKEVLPHYI